MKKILKITLVTLVTIGLLVVGFVYFGLRGIPESHVAGEVPKQEVFNEYMNRDLGIYFEKQNAKKVKVTYSLLKNEPVQSGLGSPKFFVWVYVKDSNSSERIEEGVVQVGANAGESFTVMSFKSKQQLQTERESLDQIYPSDVVVKIKELI